MGWVRVWFDFAQAVHCFPADPPISLSSNSPTADCCITEGPPPPTPYPLPPAIGWCFMFSESVGLAVALSCCVKSRVPALLGRRPSEQLGLSAASAPPHRFSTWSLSTLLATDPSILPVGARRLFLLLFPASAGAYSSSPPLPLVLSIPCPCLPSPPPPPPLPPPPS